MKSIPSAPSWSSRFVLPAVVACTALFGLVLAQGEKSAAAKAPAAPKFIGASKCKNCHQAEPAGNQFGAWQHTPHAKAFETLGTDRAKEVAKPLGIADPQTSEKCLKCHSTAFGEPPERIAKGFDPKAGVQCEACHGPGEAHMKARFAAAAAAADKAGAWTALPEGELSSGATPATCTACHNKESPTFKPFCFHERATTLRHLDPRKARTDADWEKVRVCGCKPDCTHAEGCSEGKCGVPSKDGKSPR